MHLDVTTSLDSAQPEAGLLACLSVSSPGGAAVDGAVSVTPAAATGEALGIHAKSNSREETLAQLLRGGWLVWRYALQSAARELMPQERVRGCNRWPHAKTVSILHAPEHQAACYKGLQTCGSVWMCPVCAAKISERRRLDIEAAIDAWESQGGRVVLVTYTVQHYASDDLSRSLDGLLRARTCAKTGRWAQDFNERYGVVGSIRALEVTHGKNGWHPHLHELLFVRGDADPLVIEQDLHARWSGMMGRAGLRDVNQHGVRVQFADMDVSAYVSKFGHERTWSEAHEVAKAVSKRGKEGHRTPTDLLACYFFEQDEEAGKLWQEYATLFKGKRQLVWSRGLRERLGLLVEKTDEEIAAEVSAEAVVLAELTLRQWRCVLGNDARAEVLVVAARGDAVALWEFLRKLGAGPTLADVLDLYQQRREGGEVL